MFTANSFTLQSVGLPEARKVDRRGQARHLTEEDLAALFDVLPDGKWQTIFAITYFTGSRVSDVLTLDVADIGPDRISFRRENIKTKKPRRAMVVEGLRPFLAAYDAPQSGYPFPARHNAKGGGHITRQAADLVLSDACEMIGLDGVSTHSFRRSFATNLHKQGYSLAKIARLLDHSSPTMTARYVE